MSVPVGTVQVTCPECDTVLPINVTAEMERDEDDRQILVCDSDMTDVWAHAFTHDS